ncbi:MAG: SDR family NAD(P)-dependent oxidoreductase [Alphaproteobacteria bacterium]|nr:SDR family NAD(P)-dependent oxidoreductase [Alphaproteobacteria bacterium]MBU0797214.1 SDR family NAD(P)-dependent oxidoreductase [Alphaproteobacteria bacterium]MBU0888998.1 SDR family NAD(P)-dependent oxidoreductase [Alphaproteobacteria bacterium]MBU1814018.1 SDR family NAD(P)-dependent oxidoreductase [Alphaproteobacteria bacterium]
MHPKGHVALVTGGGSGLGAATARLLAKQGATVAVLDVNAEGAAAVAKEIGGIAVACDVSSAESGAAAVAEVVAKLGAPRIVVNCAGIVRGARIVGKDGPSDLETFRKVIEVNLIGTYNIIRLTAAEMAKLEPLADGERGVITMTSSVAAFDGQIGQAAYSASKGGIVGLVLPAARDLARSGIRVMAIAPGLFHTPMMDSLPAEVQDSLGKSTPFPQRLGTAEEYADLVLAICNNVMLNGETIRLDGAVRLAPR